MGKLHAHLHSVCPTEWLASGVLDAMVDGSGDSAGGIPQHFTQAGPLLRVRPVGCSVDDGAVAGASQGKEKGCDGAVAGASQGKEKGCDGASELLYAHGLFG